MARMLFALMAAGCLVLQAGAEEKYSIKIKRESKGDVAKSTETGTESSKVTYTAMGMTQPMNNEKSTSSEYKEEILEKEPGKRATKLRRIYQKAELTKDGDKITPSFIGKEVLIEKTKSGYKFMVDDKEASGDDATFLSEEFKDKGKHEDEAKLEKILFPKMPVAINESWKPDVAEIAKDFGKEDAFTIDVEKSTATGKLTKAYKKNGKQYGVVEIDLELVVTKLGADAKAIAADKGSKLKMTMRFDGCIDGRSASGTMKLSVDMNMSGTLKTPNGVEVKVDAKVKKSGVQTQEEVSK